MATLRKVKKAHKELISRYYTAAGKKPSKSSYELFDEHTQAFIFGYQTNAIQRMLDFDYVCKRQFPSVSAIINPTREGYHKAFFGNNEIIIPMYRSLADAIQHHPETDVLINFSSHRSAYPTSLEALNAEKIRTVVIIAEGIPERLTRQLIATAKENKKVIIGPATVGGITAGKFKIGNTAGTIDNIITSKLNRPGCVGYVGVSGGLSNELYNIISRNTNGLYEGIAIGGDKYPGSTLCDHVLRYQANPKIKIIVVLGEVGGFDEYDIIEAIKKKKITKPVVAWVTGTSAHYLPEGVQFGHAGAMADSEKETARAKNKAFKAAGAIVPKSFDDFDKAILKTYKSLQKSGKIKDVEEYTIPNIGLDYASAVKEQKVRRPTNFISTISDDRGEEPTYAGVKISKLFERNYGLGEVIGLLWFKRKVPKYVSEFFEICLMVTADHGPAVSGAHNSIVTARAGKDLISSLCSGLLTIGSRFGGALDDAARYFKEAVDKKVPPEQFVTLMKSKGKYIPGIGHRIKSVQNPDKRVEILKIFAKKNCKKTKYLDFALEVEKLTTAKKNNLILNVDGAIAVIFLDILSSSGVFTKDEIDDIVNSGYLNAFFVLGRSIGFMGHYFDQKRLKTGLYRHSWDDILYITEEEKKK